MFVSNFLLRMIKCWFPLLYECLNPLLGVPVLEVVRHHLASLLVGRVEWQLQLPLVEFLAESDHTAGFAGDGLAHLLQLGFQLGLLH